MNHFNTVIMLYNMLPDTPELLEEIEAWAPMTYVEHFRQSSLDFGPLAIEAYDYAPENLRKMFETNVHALEDLVFSSRVKLRDAIAAEQKEPFNDCALRISRELQQWVDHGSSIVHGYDAALDQGAIDKLF
jgi:hypothetical protein